MKTILKRDLRILFKTGAGFWLPIIFFVFVVFLIPLGIGPDRIVHNQVAPSALWIGCVFSLLLNLDRLFLPDYTDGTIEKLIAMQIPIEEYVIAKMILLVLISGIPIAMVSPLLGVLLNLSLIHGLYASLTLIIGSLALAAIGTFGSALVLHSNRGHLLQTTTVLPFCIPVIIFGTSAIKNYVSLQIIAAELFILMGISLLSVAIFPFITAYVLKINVQQ